MTKPPLKFKRKGQKASWFWNENHFCDFLRVTKQDWNSGICYTIAAKKVMLESDFCELYYRIRSEAGGDLNRIAAWAYQHGDCSALLDWIQEEAPPAMRLIASMLVDEG